ncbi:MAG: type II toxin-antitoxin system VapC family toxin [Actinobacteria bacterium]|nr:type II toxin-antitoxin system VapC family toxin [Actinomycetota bacterium]MCG2818629.1 type II toxin-antitoxin system VapC family toxin [Actinomycetes bacterium]MBU4218182.1 type II toxin-antitoxin system VapC family toxin [Actinomycetota bacterium]MBU4358607.1 type II toxin-antitoxin system VapC family toxin [Actinomycetota bacterium]MBU4392078.1 type II toxin-antitoxin system VapC family toxin [Actinomycetota bacterium]
MGLKEDLGKYGSIGIDSCVFIYLIENNPEFADFAEFVVSAVTEGRVAGIASTVTLMEVLVKPLRENNAELAALYEVMLKGMPNLSMNSVSVPIALKAAEIRAKYNFKTPDSILLATTAENGGEAFITNEPKLVKFEDLDVLILKDYAPEIQKKTQTPPNKQN